MECDESHSRKSRKGCLTAGWLSSQFHFYVISTGGPLMANPFYNVISTEGLR